MFFVIGDGPNYNNVVNEVKEKELQDYFIFVGNKKESYYYYNAMDIFLLPSKFEGLPLVLIEAQINGLNCLASSNITEESNITGNVQYLELNDVEWKKWSENIGTKRNSINFKDKEIIQFDIRNCVKELKKIYEKR